MKPFSKYFKFNKVTQQWTEGYVGLFFCVVLVVHDFKNILSDISGNSMDIFCDNSNSALIMFTFDHN